MVALKVRKFGNSLGVILPKEALQKLGAKEGQKLFLVEEPGGRYQIAGQEEEQTGEFERQMEIAQGLMARYRNTLRALAK